MNTATSNYDRKDYHHWIAFYFNFENYKIYMYDSENIESIKIMMKKIVKRIIRLYRKHNYLDEDRIFKIIH